MISLVSTIFNDREGLEAFFRDMERQTLCPDEIVITDAGSSDGTWELLLEESARTGRPWNLVALQESSCNVARGRNLSIAAASGQIIVSTDVGCDWDPEWLEELVQPFQKDELLHLVIGSWAVRREELLSPWALTEWALKGDQRLEATSSSYSSSRSIAYRKATWSALGKYPEDLTLAADDAVFDAFVRMADVPRAGVSIVRCYWRRHETINQYFKEAYRYGLGDGEAGIRGKDIALIGGRILLEGICLLIGIAGLFPRFSGFPWWGIAFLGGAGISILLRMRKMHSAAVILRENRISHPWLRLLIFTYGTKWHWIRGHCVGRIRGSTRCLDCRERLRTMTPDIYQSRIQISTNVL